MNVRLRRVGMAQPPYWITQKDASRQIGDTIHDPRRATAIAKRTAIDRRAIALRPEQIGHLGTIQERNSAYQEIAPALAIRAARAAIEGIDKASIGHVVATSCTGYMVPGWDVQLVQDLGLSPNTVRLPITESGCAGGVVAIARAADYLRVHTDQKAIAVATELCSLAFHALTESGNLTAALIFGDGAGAAVLEVSERENEAGLEIVDARSSLIPCSRQALGFDLTDRGFYPVLTRELTEILPGAAATAACELLEKHDLRLGDIAFWLIHPGGARILSGLEQRFGLKAGAFQWSWQSLRDSGNMSSVSVFDLLNRYLSDESAPGGWGVVMAFGPGVSLELLLVRRQ
jgi:alkylresorcinol/alkylpyrone synthase